MIVVAMPNELDLIKRENESAIVTGVGPLNIIEALRGIDKDTPILNVGYAGSNTFGVGTRVLVGDVKLYHPNVEFAEKTYHLGGDVLCYTACDFVTATYITEPCVFDMELAYILALGFTNVVAIKVVSDNLSVEQFGSYSEKTGRLDG